MKNNQLNKCQELKRILNSDHLEFLMECHSGLSARIVEESGFKGGWISGLSLSAEAGVRDRNELSFKEVADLCYYICSRVDIPMLLDMDTGYGDYNTAVVAAKMIEKSGVAGVCIEDKIFPKRNSFLENSLGDLEDPFIFAGKIKAIKESVEDPDFVVVARLEEFISGAGLEEALRRALIYQDAGADAILVHSKINTFDEVKSFMGRWNSLDEAHVPIIIVPTKYYQTPTEEFRKVGISTVIWANHNLRASIRAMQNVSSRIKRHESLETVESEIATVSEVFRLQRDESFKDKEKEYLPAYGGSAVILSGGQGDKDACVPRCFVKINDDETVHDLLVSGLEREGIKDIVTVVGEYSEVVRDKEEFIHNEDWKSDTEVGSVLQGLREIGLRGHDFPLFVVYGDIVIKNQALGKLTRAGYQADIVIGVDPQYNWEHYNEFVAGDSPYSLYNISDQFNVLDVDCSIPDNNMVGSFIGILKITTAKGYESFKTAVEETYREDKSKRFVDVLKKVVRTCKVTGVYVPHHEWVDVNRKEDTITAREVSYHEC